MDCTPVKHPLHFQHIEGKIQIEYIVLLFVIVSYPSYVRRVISPVKCYTRFQCFTYRILKLLSENVMPASFKSIAMQLHVTLVVFFSFLGNKCFVKKTLLSTHWLIYLTITVDVWTISQLSIFLIFLRLLNIPRSLR